MSQIVPAFRIRFQLFSQTVGLLSFAAALACSSENEPPDANGGQAGSGGSSASGSGGSSGSASAGGGNAATGDASLGAFSVTLNPALEGEDAYTAVAGKVYSGEYPNSVIETPIASAGGCTAYKYSQQACIDVECTASQRCAGPEECRELPSVVGVGAVSLSGLGAAPLTLAVVNNNYQNAADIDYPGVSDGGAISLMAAGDHYPAFTISTTGVAPLVLKQSSFHLAGGSPLLVEWEPGQNTAARISIVLNMTRHGGSAGYLECDASDSGSLTVPANVLQSLIDLGVAGFPQLVATRYTRGVAAVTGGQISLNVSSVSVPTLIVDGICSCNDNGGCSSCSDTTKTVCDQAHRLCTAP